MEDGLFEFQISPQKLSDFLAIKSAGQQISQISPSLFPTIDLRDFFYPHTSANPTSTATGSVTTVFDANGGQGIYRIRGCLTMSGLTGITAGTVAMRIQAIALSGSLVLSTSCYLINSFTNATTPYGLQSNFDFLMDCRGVPSGETLGISNFSIVMTTVANTTSVFNTAYVVAQRIV